MDWNGDHLRPPFLSRPETSFNLLYNNYDQHYPGTEMKLPMITQAQYGVVPMMEKNNLANLDKKKRLTTEQLDSLESSFQEEIKLDPDRKMKLAQELGLQPRQVAVWFQNRRARWKAKQLERLYDSLKMELELVSREKHKLQEEVLALRAILLKDEGGKSKQVSAGYTDISGEGEDTVESTSVAAIQSSDYRTRGTNANQIQYQNQNINGDDQCNYVFNVEDYNPAVTGYWGCGANVMPSYP